MFDLSGDRSIGGAKWQTDFPTDLFTLQVGVREISICMALLLTRCVGLLLCPGAPAGRQQFILLVKARSDREAPWIGYKGSSYYNCNMIKYICTNNYSNRHSNQNDEKYDIRCQNCCKQPDHEKNDVGHSHDVVMRASRL